MIRPDSLILCYSTLETVTFPVVGEVVLMRGDPDDGLERHYGILGLNSGCPAAKTFVFTWISSQDPFWQYPGLSWQEGGAAGF